MASTLIAAGVSSVAIYEIVFRRLWSAFRGKAHQDMNGAVGTCADEPHILLKRHVDPFDIRPRQEYGDAAS
jgi:hypothetical protein